MYKAHVGVDAESPLLDMAECIPVEEPPQVSCTIGFQTFPHRNQLKNGLKKKKKS